MPKTNDQTGATYAGNQGIVEHGAPIEGGRVLSELDPERNLDGTLIEGDHPDHEDGEEREYAAPSDPRPIDEPAPQENVTPERENPDRSGPTSGKGAERDDATSAATPTSVKPGARAGRK